MSIATVRAVPYEAMADYLRRARPTDACALLASQHDRTWIISVTNSLECPLNVFEGWEAGPVPLVDDGHDRIALAFDDIEPHRDGDVEFARNPRFVYFDEAMARKVCAFVHRAHHDDANARDLLLVNCHAGVSRSGAIADFVRTVAGIDYDAFKRLNPQIVPNVFVGQKLREAWEQLGFAWPERGM